MNIFFEALVIPDAMLFAGRQTFRQSVQLLKRLQSTLVITEHNEKLAPVTLNTIIATKKVVEDASNEFLPGEAVKSSRYDFMSEQLSKSVKPEFTSSKTVVSRVSSNMAAKPRLQDLATPCFIVDIDKVKQNCENMLQISRNFGVQLRPHMKTHKTVEAAVLQTNGTKRCITVSTLAEAELFANNGFDDILLAYPISEYKIPRCLALVKKLDKFIVMVSGDDGVQCLENHIKDLPDGKVWSVVVEVDTGYGRTGYACDDLDGIGHAAQRIVKSEKMKLEKLYCHCGDSYHMQTRKESEELQASNIHKMRTVQNMLKDKFGIDCTSGIGSTPTCSLPIKENTFFTEFHPGNYIFYDYQQYMLNACTESSIACRVMTQVIAHKPEKHTILVDCGFLALSHDGMRQCLPQDYCLIEGESNLRMIGMSQEIGKVVAKEGELDCRLYPVGTILNIIPYHICAAAALHSVYHVHSGNEVIATWKPAKGW